MAIGVMDIVTVTRSQDCMIIKQNEDNKGMIQQTNVGQQFQKDTQQKTQEVRKGDNVEWQNKKFDAKEKGSNSYSSKGGFGRKKKEEHSQTERVIIKGQQSFDTKI